MNTTQPFVTRAGQIYVVYESGFTKFVTIVGYTYHTQMPIVEVLDYFVDGTRPNGGLLIKPNLVGDKSGYLAATEWNPKTNSYQIDDGVSFSLTSRYNHLIQYCL